MNGEPTGHTPAPRPTSRLRFNRRFLDLCRTVHIYLTMLGLLVLLLFGVTGFTLNHKDWFGATTPHITETPFQVPADLAARNDPLRLVEYLRQTAHITGALNDYSDLGDSLDISFRAPGEYWDVTMAKATGAANLHIEAFNFITVLNNLHRGQYSGPVWSWLIDLSALLIVLACLTGLVLWLALPKRRRLGLLALFLGAAGTLALYACFVPGPDAPALPAPPPAAAK